MLRLQFCKARFLQAGLLFAGLSWLQPTGDALIITSVIAGDKKFKTISFDHKFLKPLMFEKELPSTSFRRHRTVRPPKFDIDVNIPIKLPVEEEYAYEKPRKPVTSDLIFETSEISEPAYGAAKSASKPPGYRTPHAYKAPPTETKYADSNIVQTAVHPPAGYSRLNANMMQLLHPPQQQQNMGTTRNSELSSRADQPMVEPAMMEYQQAPPQSQHQPLEAQASSKYPTKQSYNNQAPQQYHQKDYPEFVERGYVNLQLSGPNGGPKATYEDYDRERWAQQLSQTDGAMPYPILSYNQLQNFYGGLGTFTNGLPDSRYSQSSPFDKFKAGLSHFTSKFHFG